MAKQINAIVLGNKMKNTITVDVLRTVVHPIYGKTLQRKTRFKVHNDGFDVKPGDSVLVEETKPYSKDVNFKIVQCHPELVSGSKDKTEKKAEMPKQVRHDKRKKI